MPVEIFSRALERLGPFGPRPHLGVAVSGGADSTALALLAQGYCAARGGAVRAYIVDHGLRADSATEAALTAQRLDERGIASKILKLSGLPRGAGVQAAARAARYEALAQAARADGVLHLLLGHHGADQAETVAMRAQRGPGGAEGMAGWSARNDVLLLRPLLGVQPAALREYLLAQGMGWVEDPSNVSEKFERARLRKAGVAAVPAGAADRAAREQEVAEYLAARARFFEEGYVLLDAAAAPPAALGALIRMVGGRKYPVRQAALARLAPALRPATLGGVRILPAGRLGPGWLLAREPAACAPAVAASKNVIWDGRFRLVADMPAGWMLGALGADDVELNKYKALPAIVRHGLAALRGPGGEMICPAPVRFTPPVPATSHPFVA